MRFDRCGDVVFASDFWDCDCDNDYIHRKQEKSSCEICGANSEENPDSRLNELLAFFPLLLEDNERLEAVEYLIGWMMPQNGNFIMEVPARFSR